MPSIINCSIAELPKTWEEDFNRALDETLKEMLERIKRKTPVLTGTLQEAWELNYLEISNNTDYASFVEDGTIYQRPVGMLKTTMMEFDDILEQKLKD